MARKLLRDGTGANGTYLALILFVCVAIVIFGNRRSRGRRESAVRHRDRDRQAEPESDSRRKKKKDDEEKNKKKKEAKSAVRHSKDQKPHPIDKLRADYKDAKYKKLLEQDPHNPFYKQDGIPEGYDPNNISVKPVNKPDSSTLKSAVHAPGAPSRTTKRVGYINPEDETPEGVVKEVRMHDPNSVNSIPVDKKFLAHRSPGGKGYIQGDESHSRHGPRTGSRGIPHQPPQDNRPQIIVLTNALQNAPVSMKPEDIKVLLAAVEIVCAEYGTAERNKVLVDSWNEAHGPYPIIVDEPMGVIKRYFDKHADPLIKFMFQSKASKRFEGLMGRMGLKRPGQLTPLKLLWGWFFDHFRLVSSKRKYYARMWADDRQTSDDAVHDLHESNELRVAYLLLVWLEVLAHACAQICLLSPKGVDLDGLNSRIAAGPTEKTAHGYHWTLKGSIFMPGGAGSNASVVDTWIERCAGQGVSNGVKTSWWHAKMMWDTAIGNWSATADSHEIKFRRLIFRPGWTVDAISKYDDPAAKHENPIGLDVTPIVFESDKGVKSSPSAEIIYQFWEETIVWVEPKVVSFSPRGQYSWSAGSVGYRSDGFPPGQIIACLGALGECLQGDMMKHVTGEHLDTHNTTRDFIKCLDFGICIPLEYEAKDNVKIRTFPSLSYFTGLEYVYLPYVSIKDDTQASVSRTQVAATATIALTPSMGLWEQLGERAATKRTLARKAALVVTFRPPRTGQVEADWTIKKCRNLVRELREVAPRHNINEAEWRQRIKWMEIQWQGGIEIPVDLLQVQSLPT